MAFWGDYHTHTIYSHGHGTVEENVLMALKMGLKEIAITDHGFKHMTYNVRRMDWPFIIEDVKKMRVKYPMITIYLGLETNFNSANGNIDILPSDMRYLDLVVCGYHKYVKPDRFKDTFGFFMPNFIYDTLHIKSKKMMVKNTDAYLKALEKYHIDIISHMNYGITVDPIEVAKACKHYGTHVELNGKHINLKDDQIIKMAELGVSFICNSDAHSAQRIGDLKMGQAVMDRLDLPKELIANWEKLPVFRSRLSKERQPL